MSSSAAVVLLVCVVVCLEGQCFSQNIDDGEKTGGENSVLNQVLDELQSLRDTVGKHEERISQMKDTVGKHEERISQMKDEDKKNKDEIKNLKDSDKKKMDEINHLKDADKKKTDEINHLNGQNTSSQAAVVGSSAFMAVNDGGITNPAAGEVILFDHMLLNLGQHYDPQTSIFTCAESGLYLFSVTLYSGREGIWEGAYGLLSGALMVDGVNVAEIQSATYDFDDDQGHQSAVTAVVECPQGVAVWVECQESNSQVFGTDVLPSSIFTGYAISYYIHP